MFGSRNKRNHSEIKLTLGVHVDDTIVTSSSADCDASVESLRKLLPTNHLRELTYCTSRVLKVSQTTSIDQLVDHIDLPSTSLVPASSSVKLRARKEGGERFTESLREAVGGSLWLVNMTHLATLKAVPEVAKHVHDPSKKY